MVDRFREEEAEGRPCHFVMILAGIELIFFVEAHTMLCLRFFMKVVVIKHQCFSCCRAVLSQSQRLFSFSCCPFSKEAGGCTRSLEGTQPRQVTQTDKGNIAYHTISCSAINVGVKEEEGGGTLRVMAFVFSINRYI